MLLGHAQDLDGWGEIIANVSYVHVRRPVITTDDGGNLKFMSEGDLVFETGPAANVKFMSTDGSTMKPPEGLKGDKVRS